ncbi:hypothetical protein V1505DRAFT_390814 [Lipomyces doorenjongii]
MRNAEGFRIAIIIAISKVLEPLDPDSVSRIWQAALVRCHNAMFPAREEVATYGSVPLEGKLALAHGIDGLAKEKVASPTVEKLLAKYKSNGTADKVWNYVMSDFKRIEGAESMTE